MKKKKLITKLSLRKNSISDLSNVNGGKVPPETYYDGCNNDTDNCGTGNCGSNYCTGQTCGNCYTNDHPASDPIHCRTCNTGC